MYRHDAINTTSVTSFHWCVKSKPVATHGFPAPPHTVLTPLIPLLLNKVWGLSKFYKFVRLKKKTTNKPAQNIHTLFEIAFLWYPDGDSWVRNAFSIHLIHLSATERNFVAWLSSVWINCLDYSLKIILMKAVTVLCFFSIDSILQILTKWTTLPISDGKLAWISQT